MSSSSQKKTDPLVSLPDIPALTVNTRQAAILTTDGEIKALSHKKAGAFLHRQPVLVCHAPYTYQKLQTERVSGFDVLELFAFVHPAKFCVPTPVGLAKTLGLNAPEQFEDTPFTLIEIAQSLLANLQRESRTGKKADPLEIARVMGLQGKGWAWTPYIFAAWGEEYDIATPLTAKTTLNIWKHLPEWSEEAPPPAPTHHPVTGEESRDKLTELLDSDAEARPQQRDYATALTTAFSPLEDKEDPHITLAEAGTGVGKTLGYLAPASVWAEKNSGPVWISTYTKNLQRQVDQELDRLYPTPEIKDSKVAIRKGRENYLCLLNLEDTVAGAALAKYPDQALAAGLMARWAETSRDGDMQGGDFPGWLSGLLGYKHTLNLADKRGECIYAACDHYHKCFVERSVRKSRHASIVVANHALVMIQTALSNPGDELPQRYVFDEGHHLFDAADSAFSGHLTARETCDLRRWILGAEGGRQSRARGLKRRAEDLIAGEAEAEALLQAIMESARALAAQGWSHRLKDKTPQNATEKFLALVYQQVFARANGQSGPYSLETQTQPLIEHLPDAAKKLQTALRMLQTPMKQLSAHLKKKLNDHADTLDSDTRKRLESLSSGLDRRAQITVGAWIDMLTTLQTSTTDNNFIDWMEIERIEGKAYDVGLYRHWTDPMKPFAAALKPHAHGIAITSATLRDHTGDEEQDWRTAQERTGAGYFSSHVEKISLLSPFDYQTQTKIFVLTDINKNDMEQVASACRELFKASGGGGLGLFTAIQRLRAIQTRIAGPLEDSGIPLYAQHVDGIDTGTLVDMFRVDPHACLLGTDAVRDGIDVPGESLRLLIYDRVPWPRPTILHKARRDAFGGRRYDEMITRLKLQQAYGRLIRRADDKGVFVMLDSGLPSKLHGAFPEGVEVERLGLAETLLTIKSFL